MKQKATLTRSRWLLACLLSLLLTLGGTGTAWGYDVLLEGFESNNLTTNGWTTVNPGTNASAISTDAHRTGSYCYKFYYYSSSKGANSPRYLISKELSIPANATNTYLSFYYSKYSSGSEKFKVGYSTTTNETSEFTWSENVTDAAYNSWKEFSMALENNVKYIAIQYCSGDQYYLYIDDIALTCDVTGPALSVADGATTIASGYSYNFGLAAAGTTKEFTLSNPGTEAAPITIGHTGSFGVSPTSTSIPAGESVTLTVTMPEATGNDIVTISSSSDAIDDFVINLSGTIKDPNKYFQDFQSASPEGWTKGSWSITTTGSGTSNNNGYATAGMSNSRLKGLRLTFSGTEKLYFNAAANASYPTSASLKVQKSTDGENFEDVGEAISLTTDWGLKEVAMPAGTYYIAFYGKYCYVTDVYGGQYPDAPTNVTVTDITANGATIGWTKYGDQDAWQVSYSTVSGNPDNGTKVSADSESKAITGLNANTTYYVYVRADKGGDVYGDWSEVYSFKTAYGTPFTENFGTNSIPAGWSKYSGLLSNILNGAALTSTESGWSFGTSNGVFDSHAKVNVYGTTCYYWLVTPNISLSTNKQVSFDLALTAYSGGAAQTTGTDDKFVVLVSADNGSTWTNLAQWDNAGAEHVYNNIATEGENVVLSLAAFNNQTVKLAFYVESTTSNADNNLHIDNVDISDIPACPKPTGLTASNPTWQGATLAWTAGSDETEWKVIYGATGFDPASEGTTINVTTNPYTLTGLTPETEYDVYVKAVKGGDVSPVSNKATFTTTERYPAPANLAISNLTTTSARLTWNAAGESSWEVAINTTGATPATEAGTGTVVNAATYDFSELTTETTYYAFVRVKDGENFSNWSTACEFTPSAYTYLTVNDGATTNTYAPIYGYFSAASNLGGQFIIPAANLTEVQNKVIKKLTFYSNTSEYDYGEAEFDVCIKEVANATMTSSMYAWDDASWTTVYNGTLAIVGGKMTIIFSSDYNYNGSNLLVGIHKTSNDKSGSNYNVAFYGTNASSGNYRSNYAPNGNRQLFQPKTTIGYQEKTGAELKVYDGETELTESPASFDFGFVPAGTTHTFTLKNTAATSYTAVVSSANLTIDPTTAITPDADGETFTVTMPNHDINNEAVVITPEDGKGLTAFTINVSGRYRDVSKIFVDFTNDAIPTAWTASKWYRSSYNGYIYDDGTTAESHAELTTSRIVSTNENLTLSAKLKTDAGILNVWWSADGAEWLDENKTELKTQLNTTEFTSVNVNVPATAKYVKFEGYNAYIKSIYGLADAPLMKVRKTAEGANLSTPQTVDFGLTASADAETFYVVNASAGSLAGVDAALTGTGFTLNETNLTAAGGDFTIAVNPTVKGYREATVTVSGINQEDFVINLKAFVPGGDGKMYVDFNDNLLPANWSNTATNQWTFAEGKAYAEITNNTAGNALLQTCKLTVAADEVLAIKAKGENNTSELRVRVYQNGQELTAKKATFDSQVEASTENYKTLYFTGLAAGDYKLVFDGWKVYIDEIAGFTVNPNDPELKVYSDALATQEVATATTKDFGWVANDADDAAFTSTYYIKNNGTGTLTISNISAVEGFTAATAENATTVSGENTLALTITMDKNAVGAKSGTFTLMTDGGNFTIPVKGFVCDHSKNLVDFTANGAKFPAGWTAGSWTITDGAAISTSSSTIQTKKFTVAANENLYVDIKGNESAYDTKALSYSYSIDNGENWSEATSLVASTTGTVNDQVFTISDIASSTEERTVLIRITGQKLGIKHIYGFTRVDEAVMTTTAVAHDFGMQASDVEPATNAYVFTVSNEGNIDLTNLAVTLGNGNESAFTVAVAGNKTTLAAGESAEVTVTMKSSTVYGAKNDNLTIAADGQTPVVIALSGKTRDVAKQYVEFATEIPNGWTSNGWGVTNGEAKATNGTLRTTPLTIAANETMAVDARISNSGGGSLKVRYTTNNGVDWQETTIPAVYNYTTCSTYTFNLGNTENAVTAFFEFVGENAVIDNFYGGVAATAPLLEVTENTSAVANNDDFDFGSNLQAEPTAKVFTLANKGNASMNVTIAKTGDVTVTPAAATIAAGETADVTVSLPYDQTNVGDKTGTITITLGTAEFTLNFTGNTIDPTALNEELASLPAGWYNAGWAVDGSAHIYSGVEQELISEQFAAEAGKNVLSFKAKAQSGNEGTLKVYTSADRKTWSEPTEFALTNEYASKSLAALADGNYYVKFVSLNANIDDLTGLKKIATVPEHDLYVSTSNIPTDTKVPGTEITATATVYSLRAAETGVYAKLFFDETEVATAAAQDISLNGSKTFTLTGNVPAAEKTYAAKIVVYYSDNSVAFETLTTNVEVQHTRTLAITAFARVGEGDLSADVDNKITAQFNVTVQNNSTCDLTADEVKVSIVNAAGEVYQMNDADNVTAATAVLAKEASVVIPVTLTISAGEGGDFKFRAKELVSNTATLEANDITIHVNAQAPQFALNIKGGAALTDGDDVAFGLVKEATTKQYTISNTGTKALVLTSIAAPAGYSVTEINNVNKTIAVNGTLDIDVTLLAEQGKKAGDLVFTYDVNGTPTTFTLALTGRSEAANVWEEYFTSEIPASWQKTGWTWNADRQTAYSGGVQGEFTLMTPRLSAAAGQVLTYETKWQYDGENMTVQYSTDKTSWTDYETVTASIETVEHQFVAPAAGNYYLKFTANRYVNLDNFIGFALNIPEHDMELAASDVPTTGKRLNSYVATVTLKENAGKNENITAELWVAGAKVNATADVASVEANSNATVVTLTWEPQTMMNAVDAYVKVTYAGGTLQTTPVSLTIAEVYTLSENSNDAVEAVTNETVMLQRTFAAGWNTICLPFAVADNTAIETLFGSGTKVFNFKNYANSMIDFEAVTSMTAATPYLIYVPAAITEPIRVNNVTISNLNTTAGTVWHNSITFHGSYAPVAAGGLTGKYGVTTTNQLAKGNTNTTMKGFRAYFEGNLANARIFIFDEATGISRVYQAADLFDDDDRVYNMKGQQVENAKKGVYIVNGRKVVIK